MSFDHLDPAYRRSVSYIDKSREYYQAQGYTKPYQWESNLSAPFAPLETPLAEATVGVITTAFPVRPKRRDHSTGGTGHDRPEAKKAYAAASTPTPDAMFTRDLAWHQTATHTEDVGTFLPLDQLNALAREGRIGAVSQRFYGVPTEYSRSKTERDAQIVLEWCQQDKVDLALLVPL